jgi:hypothetical protein
MSVIALGSAVLGASPATAASERRERPWTVITSVSCDALAMSSPAAVCAAVAELVPPSAFTTRVHDVRGSMLAEAPGDAAGAVLSVRSGPVRVAQRTPDLTALLAALPPAEVEISTTYHGGCLADGAGGASALVTPITKSCSIANRVTVVPAPALEIASTVTVVEGDGPGSTPVTLAVSSAVAVIGACGFTAQIVDETTTAADFVESGPTTHTFTGSSAEYVVAMVERDLVDEADESFRIMVVGTQVGDAPPCRVLRGGATATIQDDDASIRRVVSFSGVSVIEGTGTPFASLRFVIRLDAPAFGGESVALRPGTGTAVGGVGPGSDYRLGSVTVVFSPGDIERSVFVPVFGDDVEEPDETAVVVLVDPVGLVLDDSVAEAMILNDDLPAV